MARGNIKDSSAKKPTSKVKCKDEKPAPTETKVEPPDEERLLSDTVLHRVSDKLGIPRGKISHIPDTAKQVFLSVYSLLVGLGRRTSY